MLRLIIAISVAGVVGLVVSTAGRRVMPSPRPTKASCEVKASGGTRDSRRSRFVLRFGVRRRVASGVGPGRPEFRMRHSSCSLRRPPV